MRILIANKFHYPRGGDCIYSMELARLLQSAGHETAFFAMAYPGNTSSEWQDYFPSEVAFSPRSPPKMLKGLVRPVHAPEVRRKFNRLLDDFKPDVVHLNNIHTQLSPVIARLAHERGCRVVWTLHDYKLLCPRYDCLRDGKPCELCFGGDKSFVLKYACLKGSRLASTVALFEARKWSRSRLEAWTDVFICPSDFMRRQMTAGGFDPAKLHVLPNFVDAAKVADARPDPGGYYLYAGRLSEEKGLRTLIRTALRLSFPLKVAGTGPLEAELKALCADAPHIEFLGHLAWDELRQLLLSARFLVVPSEWYENNPLNIIEALALGVPVVGANIGGIPELVRPGRTGVLFEPGNPEDLQEKLTAQWDTTAPRPVPAEWAEVFSAQRYLRQLLPLYGGAP